MNAKIWGAIAVALVLGACGKQEEATTEVEVTTPPAAEVTVTPAPEPTPMDPAATDPAVTIEATVEEPAPAP